MVLLTAGLKVQDCTDVWLRPDVGLMSAALLSCPYLAMFDLGPTSGRAAVPVRHPQVETLRVLRPSPHHRHGHRARVERARCADARQGHDLPRLCPGTRR
eukprot:1943901-Rhodomonas_salina.2